MAAAPPAVAVVPFTKLLCGDMKIAVLGSSFNYLASLFVAPAIILSLLGLFVDINYLLWILILLILLPLLVSRLIAKIKSRILEYSSGSITILSLALVTYSIVALNQAQIFREPLPLLPVFFIILIRTFVSGSLVLLVLRRLRVNSSRAVTYSLFCVVQKCRCHSCNSNCSFRSGSCSTSRSFFDI